MFRTIGTKQVIELCTHWRYYVQCHLPLVEAIQTMGRDHPHKGIKEVLSKIESDLCQGQKLSMALKRFPKIFDPVFVQLMYVAEQVGDYGTYLDHGERYLRWRWHLVKLIYEAIRYPMILGVLVIVLFVIIHSLLLPQMEQLFQSLRLTAYPLSTRVFMQLMMWFPLILLGGISIGAFLWHKNRHKIPILGAWFLTIDRMIFIQQLGILLEGKVDLISAITIAAQSTRLSQSYDRLIPRLMEGLNLSKAMEVENFGHTTLRQMVDLGERTGKLGEILVHYSQMELDLLKQKMMTWAQLIQPLLVVFMGLLLGGFIGCILWPLYDLITQHGG